MKKLFLSISIFMMSINVYAIDSGKYKCGNGTNIDLKSSGRAIVDNKRGNWNNYGDEAVVINNSWTFDDKGNGKFVFTRPNPYIPGTIYSLNCFKVTKLTIAKEKQRIAERKQRIAKEKKELRKAEEKKKKRIAKEKRERPLLAKSFGFTGIAKDVYLDKDTNLAWQDDKTYRNPTWEGFEWQTTATDYCKKLTLGNVTDWRVPTIEELKTLFPKKKYANPNDPSSNLKTMQTLVHYWSSSSGPKDQNGKPTQLTIKAVRYGYAVKEDKLDSTCYIRCVRDRK